MKLIDLLSDYFSRRSVRAYGLSRAECGVAFVQDMDGTVRTVCFTEGADRKEDLRSLQSRLRLTMGVWNLPAFNLKERNSARILSGKDAALSIIRLSKECIPEEKIAPIVLPQAEDFEYALVDSRDVLAAIAEAEATQTAGNPVQEEAPEKPESESQAASESPEVPAAEVPAENPFDDIYDEIDRNAEAGLRAVFVCGVCGHGQDVNGNVQSRLLTDGEAACGNCGAKVTVADVIELGLQYVEKTPDAVKPEGIRDVDFAKVEARVAAAMADTGVGLGKTYKVRFVGKPPEIGAPYGVDKQASRYDELFEVPAEYESLFDVLVGAFEQASRGKGRERHANNLPFEVQPMQTLSDALQADAGMAFQAMKKIRESRGLPKDAAIRELHGAINYIAGMVIWRQKQEK